MNDNVKRMNEFMNKVALNTFSFFDSGNKPSRTAESDRFDPSGLSCFEVILNHRMPNSMYSGVIGEIKSPPMRLFQVLCKLKKLI